MTNVEKAIGHIAYYLCKTVPCEHHRKMAETIVNHVIQAVKDDREVDEKAALERVVAAALIRGARC